MDRTNVSARSSVTGGYLATSLAKDGRSERRKENIIMGRGILLWLLGVPISVIILLALFWH